MWTVTFERHHHYEVYDIKTFQIKSGLLANLVYQVWSFGYVMSIWPVKYVSIFHHENGTISLNSWRKKMQGEEFYYKLRNDYRLKGKPWRS